MSFSSIVWPARSSRTTAAAARPSALQLPPGAGAAAAADEEDEDDDDEPDLRELNGALQALAALFPDIQPDVFREMLTSFSPESRLEVITETLLKHGAKWVRGRYRTPPEHGEQATAQVKYKYRRNEPARDTRGTPLAVEDTFRSRRYRDAAKAALYQEFAGMSHSTVKAVLAECNWSYSPARPILLELASKSWRASITALFTRRKRPTANDHPLVVWPPVDAASGARVPVVTSTKSSELDRELYNTLVLPELERQRRDQVANDFQLASQLNEAAAEEAGEMYDCECCFSPNTLEQMSTCHTEGHYICFRCIRHSINAALYDQGWARNISSELATLRCIAPLADGVDDCSGCVPLHFVKRALLEGKDGADTYRKLKERFSAEAILKSGLPLVRCPFCPYAELDDTALSGVHLFSTLKLRRRRVLLASIPLLELFCSHMFRVALQILFLLATLLTLLNCYLSGSFDIQAPLESALRRIRLKRRGLRFQCLSPTCARPSCLSCSAPWHDPHVCYSSQLTSLRLTLERATTDAIKRTCPTCNLGFVKSEGCNKLVCLCGYSMCYVCRQGLAVQGYNHFCQHFRERPGTKCRECDKCDLYRTEDDDVVVKRARERAEKEWWSRQGADKEDAVGLGLKREGLRNGELRAWDGNAKGSRGINWDWESWLETLLESLLV